MSIRNIDYKKALLCLLTIFVSIRLLGFIIVFGEKTLQLDFAAYYTAGEALNAHLSPYKNYLTRTPRIWDGYVGYKNSRFLYPPLAAELFRPIALLDYHAAKYLWMILSLAALIASLYLAFISSEIRLDFSTIVSAILLLFIFHPLLKFLSFGQIDAFTLLLLTLGIYLILNREEEKRMGLKVWQEWIAGILFSIATLLKLHNVFILPFIVLRKKWNALGGYAIGGLIIIILTLFICGTNQLITYITDDLPRISKYDSNGTKEMLLPNADSIIASIQPGKGLTVKDGRVYSLSRRDFEWTGNATLVRTYIGQLLQTFFSKLGFSNSLVMVSLLIFVVFFILICIINFNGGFELIQKREEFLYWQLVLIIILLSAPRTWVTNTVWVITLFPLIINGIQSSPKIIPLIIIFLGLLFMAIPDLEAFPILSPVSISNHIFDYKYVAGELLIFTGLLIYLISNKNM
jgi:hypothetical protein